jgi:1-acylglycerone phosphate reductase
VTVITGVVASNFFANVPDYHTPEGSLYRTVEQNIGEIEKAVGKSTPTDEYAEKVVSAVIAGATGKLYEGNQSTLVRFATSFLPTFIQVSFGVFLDR